MGRIEIGQRHQPPSEEILHQVERRGEKMGRYTHAEYQKIQQSLHQEATKEPNREIRRANEAILTTVDAIHAFAMTSRREANQPLERWQKTSKLVACRAAQLTMFTADALQRQPELLNIFWDKIYTPLAKSGGYTDSELEPVTNGMMAELAVGKALDQIIKRDKSSKLEVQKTTPEEDVNKGRDLVIASEDGKTEWPLQVKLRRGGAEAFVDWVDGQPPEVRLYYGRRVEDLFNPRTGEPTSILINELTTKLPRSWRRQAA